MVKWVEPGGAGECLHVSCSEADAIMVAKAAAAQRGFEYANDEAALQDFLTVHWAWIETVDFARFWCEVEVWVLLDTLMLVKDCRTHPCFFQRTTLFDIRRTIVLTAVYGLSESSCG